MKETVRIATMKSVNVPDFTPIPGVCFGTLSNCWRKLSQ